ncbi:MAG: type I glutamate--ammonia ligase [Lachnospiraceae bacterium]|jgi:glutamine synthetase|nr:type I glutamate--ammonia ligase [Lachnospiraceae bacterium]
MARYTKEDVIRIVEEEDVEFIRLQFTDIFGMIKNVAITSSQLTKALNNQYTFDAAAIEGLSGSTRYDMCLHPDLDTFEIFPWRPQQGKVARFICDIYDEDGRPAGGDSRSVLRRVCEEAEEIGYHFRLKPECEFFLFQMDDRGLPTTITHEKASYFDVAPNDFAENVRRDIVLNLEEMGFEIESSHHEIGAAQHEIDFAPSDALTAADNLMTFKMATKSIARRHGLHATFMPKPKGDDYGSGMHLFMSLTGPDGKDVFGDPEVPGGLSAAACSFITGILRHMPGMTAILNPLVNSYKRFVPGYEAPVTITWSAKFRDSLIGIPNRRTENTLIELRSPDSTTNPYLAFALVLAAGLDGVKRGLRAEEPVDRSLAKMDRVELAELGLRQLPMSLGDAVEAMNEDAFIKKILGKQIAETYIKTKRREWNVYNAQVTQWELDQYLNKY